jgi:hypothetical protein
VRVAALLARLPGRPQEPVVPRGADLEHLALAAWRAGVPLSALADALGSQEPTLAG